MPPDAKLVVALELDDPDFGGALDRLVAGAREQGDLPIVSGMALSQLPLQLAVMRTTLAQGGFAPATLILLHTSANEPVWVLRAPCDLERMRGELERRWAVRTRGVVGGVVGERDPARAASAHVGDVVFASDDRVAITPAGAGARLLKWLEGQAQGKPDAIVGAGASTAGAPRIDAIPRAPVRVLLQGPGLLAIGSGGSAKAMTSSGPVALRATAATLERVALAPG